MPFPSAQMFEGTYAPPVYLDLYNFKDGAQDDIFLDSYAYIPTPGPNQGEVPTPINEAALQPSSTDTANRNSIGRTMRGSSASDFLFNVMLSIVALYVGDVF